MDYPEWMRPALDLEPWMEAMEGRPGTADVRRKPRQRHRSEMEQLRSRMAMANPMTRRRMAASAAASAAKGNA